MITLLFWFDYLTADVLGVLVCIEKVHNKPTALAQPSFWKLTAITHSVLPTFDNAQALFIWNLNHFSKDLSFAANNETQG